jgi:hypothetical protein
MPLEGQFSITTRLDDVTQRTKELKVAGSRLATVKGDALRKTDAMMPITARLDTIALQRVRDATSRADATKGLNQGSASTPRPYTLASSHGIS